MNFKGFKDINKPRSIVVEMFKNPKYLGEYQEGFVRKELISGTEGQDSAISKMYYKSDKYDIELTETITANRLPDTFEAFYHHKHMDNTMKCSFISLNENKTRYEYEVKYTRINWFMPKIMAILFPGMYRKQGEKWMQNFKVFVEKQ
ncbi:hypothetical protein [uncultured Aquimarina sp.]|uniref:hypothetical protein n=1 Tax=uncultured Aquimarina sp. TaxID=575652 RepID=UPI002629D3A8|nr:hypothetical protein [uncultured Aquimarina sp.]